MCSADPAAGRSEAHIVRMRSLKYAEGEKGANGCDAGTSIESEAECRAAATSLGNTWREGRHDSDQPKGCLRYTSGNVWGTRLAVATPILCV